MADLPSTGKFKISAIGPVKNGTSKKTGKPYRVFSLQFEGDAQWYDAYWVAKEDPTPGMEMEGTKSFDQEFSSYKFETQRSSAGYNPAGANATVMLAAINFVNGFLGLDPKNIEAWEKKRKKDQDVLAHYTETVIAMAGILKSEVVKMGGTIVEVKSSENNSTPPPAESADPGPTGEDFPGGDEEEVELGPM